MELLQALGDRSGQACYTIFMAKGADVSNLELLNHILNLKSDVEALQATLRGDHASHNNTQGAKHRLDVYIDHRSGSERKPFIVTVDGLFKNRSSMSAVRVMILLVLLLDLKDRCDGGKGIIDRRQAIRKAYDVIVGGEVTDLDNTLRSALYRFEVFLADQKLLRNSEIVLRFDFEECQFRVDGMRPDQVPEIDLSVSSPLPVINAVINDLLASSPLTRLRREKALYAPPGPQGIDLMLAEMFDHQHPVSMTALFSRPSLQNFPYQLLQKIGASDQRLRRAKVVQDGYVSGRCKCLEILPRERIRNLIRADANGKFLWYPETIKIDDVEDHLNRWADLVEADNAYTLAITDAVTPFHMATFELNTAVMPEFYTMFMQRLSFEFMSEEGCFVVGERSAYTAISEHIVYRMLHHPTTVREFSLVAEELRLLAEQLRSKGPLPLSAA